MKKDILFCVVVGIFFSLFGCATVPTQPCTIYEDAGATPQNSIIAQNISDPCRAQNMLAKAAKIPIIWGKKGYAEKFDIWAENLKFTIEAGITYADLQDLVIMKVAEFNKEAGLALLILSDDIYVFGDYSLPLKEIDRKLVLMSLADLRLEVKQLAIIAGD